jgi:hypothetical protein
MVAFISHVTIDCRDAYAQAQWWKQVLGYVDDPEASSNVSTPSMTSQGGDEDSVY